MNAKRRHAVTALALTIGLSAATSSIAQPQANITMSPLHGYVSGPSGLEDPMIVAGPGANPKLLRVDPLEVVGEVNFQWVHFPVTTALHSSGVVTAVEVCYDIDAVVPGTTYISQTRLTDTVAPPNSLVVMDDPTDRVDTESGCYTVEGLSVSADGALDLSLKVVFGDVDDTIRFGMLRYIARRQP